MMHLRWDGDQRWTGRDSWGNEVPVDGDRASGTGPRPSDLLPISLAVCVGYTLVQGLEKRRQDLRSLEATIEVEQEPDPPWAFRRIDVHFVATGDVDREKAERALVVAHEKYCAVTASLPNTAMNHTIEVRAG